MLPRSEAKLMEFTRVDIQLTKLNSWIRLSKEKAVQVKIDLKVGLIFIESHNGVEKALIGKFIPPLGHRK